MREFILLVLLCHIGAIQAQTRNAFYTKLTPGCLEANISKPRDCPYVRNVAKSRWNVTNTKTRPKFKTYSAGNLKCHYKLIEREQTCNSIPTCVMTTYTYALPRPSKNVKTTECTNTFSIEANCSANGLENLKTVYSQCFNKGSKSYCTIDFQSCKPFHWTEFMLQCYVPCDTLRFRGIAERLVKKCMSHDGKIVDDENCYGNGTTSTPSKVSSKCITRSTVTYDIEMCNDTSTEIHTTDYKPTNVPTSTAVVYISTTQPDIQQSTTVPVATGMPTSSTSINITATSSETSHVFNSKSFPGVGSNSKTFDILPVAGGAGAGLLFVFILTLIIVLLVRRRDYKSSAGNSILSSTSSYKTKYGRNPVVDSGSFRIATWIRERPSLPNGGSTSPSDSVVSDAEYWKVGESYDDLTAKYVKDRRDSKSSDVPDVVKTVPANKAQENLYDEVYTSGDDDAPTTSNRTSTPIANRQSSSSNSFQNDGIANDIPIDKNAVYAAVQKSRRREQMQKRSSATSMGASRRRIASQHSVTNLHARQLRDGVLQIEFDDEQGVKCKLSESDTYIDLEEDGLPPVF